MGRNSTTTSKSALYWYAGHSPLDMMQKFSIIESSAEGKAGKVVSETVDNAVNRMQQIIIDGGINATQKGGPRILSGDMLNSVTGEVTKSDKGRVAGSFGFGDNAPLWAKFQERGTHLSGPKRKMHKDAGSSNGGIAPMLAYATALEEAIVDFQNKFDEVQWFASSKLSII